MRSCTGFPALRGAQVSLLFAEMDLCCGSRKSDDAAEHADELNNRCEPIQTHRFRPQRYGYKFVALKAASVDFCISLFLSSSALKRLGNPTTIPRMQPQKPSAPVTEYPMWSAK